MGNANIFISNQTDSPADVYLYHAQLTPGSGGLVNETWVAFPNLASGATSPAALPVSWDAAVLADYWGVMICVSGGSRPGVYVTASHAGDPPYYRESMLEAWYDNGTSPVFTVNWDSFNIKLHSNGSGGDPVPMTPAGPYSPVSNVYVLMLENHSFDNILGLSGIAGITPPSSTDCNTYGGNTYCVNGAAPTNMSSDPGHEFMDVVQQLSGNATYTGPAYPSPINLSGFAANYATTTDEDTPPPTTPAQIGQIMACFGASEIQTLLPNTYKLASNNVVCDNWFSSLPGPTWPNRFFLHLGSSEGLNYSPTKTQMGSWELTGVNDASSTYPGAPSIFDSLKGASIPFALYQDWSGPVSGSVALVSALKGIDMVTTVTSLYQDTVYNGLAVDLQRPYPYRYTFIEPNYGDSADNTYTGGSSQHPMDNATSGDTLLGYIYTTLAASPMWHSSVLIVTYDEHGGFYDHVTPPGGATPPGDALNPSVLPPNDDGLYRTFDFAQLGVRVPAIVISPLISSTPQVDHTQYDHTSVLATLENILALPNLTARDKAATPLSHLWQLGAPGAPAELTARAQRPRMPAVRRPAAALPPQPPPRTPLSPRATAERMVRLQRPLPLSGNLIGLLGLALKAELNLGSWTPTEREAMIARVKAIQTRAQADAYLTEVDAKLKIAAATQKKERVAMYTAMAAAKPRKTPQ